MKKRLCVLFLSLSLILSLFSLSHAFSTKGGGHQTITNEAATIKRTEHSGDRRFRSWLDGGEGNLGALPNFLTGTHDEDCTPLKRGAAQEVPIDLEWPIGPNRSHWGNFFEHFYNPQTGAGLWGNRTAIQRAQDYEKLIKGYLCVTSTKKYDGLSPIAKTYVNDYFGRIQHLIEDMGISYHTKLEPHALLGPIEGYVAKSWDKIVSSDLFKKELAEANPTKGTCIDPKGLMRSLAAWSFGLPNESQYLCEASPTNSSCLVDHEMIDYNATRMAARATKFASSYTDQIYNAINTDCICKDEPPGGGGGSGAGGGGGGKQTPRGPGGDHPDDNFAVSDWAREKTQFGFSQYEFLDFYMRLAIKKGNITPFYMKQFMEIYAEGRALPANATDEQKNA